MSEQKSCPDGGRCWHECVDRCFRVNNCGPLSGVFDGNEWPDDIKTQHAESARVVCDYCSVLRGQGHAGYCLTRLDGSAEKWRTA